MPDAESALIQSSKSLPAEILERLVSNKELGNEDGDIILKLATKILEPFLINPDPDQNKK